MAFWSTETFVKNGPGKNIVTPFSPARIKHGAYELSLGKEAYVTSSDDGKKTLLSEGAQFVVPPGQFAMLLTEEVVQIPPETIGLISIKAGIKFRGLVNVSGFHVDPGYKGKLKFSVYNAGSQKILLTQNQPLFLLWLVNLDVPTKDIYTHGEKGGGITATDVMNMQGEVFSPAELNRKIEKLHHSFDNLRLVASVVVTLLVSLLVAVYGKGCAGPRQDKLRDVTSVLDKIGPASVPAQIAPVPAASQAAGSSKNTQESPK